MRPSQLDLVRGVVVQPGRIGVSDATSGATGLGMELIELAPRCTTAPCAHPAFETALFVLEGRLEVRHGTSFEHRVTAAPGEFCFIAAQVPYELVNPSTSEPARAIVARNTGRERGGGQPEAPVAAHQVRSIARVLRARSHHDAVSPVERLARA